MTTAASPRRGEGACLDPRDLRIETFDSGGMQLPHVRITHVPTGVQVSAADEPTQTQNRIKAMKLLRERLRNQSDQLEEK